MSTPSLPKQIKAFLSEGPKLRTEIHKSVSGKSESINQAIRRLESGGTILEIQPDILCVSDPGNVPMVVPDATTAVENSRKEAENTETINKLLNLYDLTSLSQFRTGR